MVMTIWAPSPAAATPGAARPRSAASRFMDDCLWSCPVTWCPALTRFAAIGLPMMPRPMNPIRDMRLPPAEARRAVRRIRRLVLAADPAGVPLLRDLPEQGFEVELARSRSAAVWHVGDLDVRDVGGVAGQHLRQVLAH